MINNPWIMQQKALYFYRTGYIFLCFADRAASQYNLGS